MPLPAKEDIVIFDTNKGVKSMSESNTETGPVLERKRHARGGIRVVPCANCARLIVSRRQRIYCSDLCSQVADWVRYFQRTRADGRWRLPDIQESLSVRLAHISAGGYDDSGRSLSAKVRGEIIERDGGICRKCGKPGNEIDHIAGSSADLSNLQLLCRDCHMEKTMALMVPATPDVVARVFDPIHERALEVPNRQPCDSMDWNHHSWVSDASEVSEGLRIPWVSWLRGPGSIDIDPETAVAGFPRELDPWSWYRDEPLSTAPSLLDLEKIRLAQERSAREVDEFYRSVRRMQETERERRQAQPITNALPFLPTISGKGKWHVSYADVYGTTPTSMVAHPRSAPACGSSPVELDPTRPPITPTVGEPISKYIDLLCGRCIGIRRKGVV